MRAVLISATIVLIFGTLARADEWTFFYPKTVTKFGCRVEAIGLRPVGSQSSYRTVWGATAWAKRSENGDWAMKVGEFPHTTAGRHQAESVCSKWQDEAERLVNGARK